MSAVFSSTAEEIRAADRVERDPWDDLLIESDNLRDWLELALIDDRRELPASARRWLRELHRKVTRERMDASSDATQSVQNALDHLYDHIQPPILRERCRQRGLLSAHYAPEEASGCTCSCGPCVQARMGDTHSEHCGGTSCG